MVKYGSSHRYSLKNLEGSEIIKAKASNLTVKFKNLVAVARAIRKMPLKRANAYLKNVLAHKECVPFTKFKSGVGKCAQAKQFKTTIGRWVEKAVKCVQGLLRNAIANCEFYGKDPEDFFILHIQASQAPILTRRTYRAHGRINAYNRHTSHIQVILKDSTLNK
ncbi:60S ribosomal protein L17-like [Anoplophora glabripennis]|uniref:60S ribosomal protein L17-like n=1 Tax=Anoplophora glabripennis TaxID=217634 RepID=UPI000875370E|nr:60S ribosomal protein L17-like [Anoplophora glabripennis]